MFKKLFSKINRFVDGDVSFEIKPKEAKQRKASSHSEKTVAERYTAWHDRHGYKTFRGVYIALSCLIAVFVISDAWRKKRSARLPDLDCKPFSKGERKRTAFLPY